MPWITSYIIMPSMISYYIISHRVCAARFTELVKPIRFIGVCACAREGCAHLLNCRGRHIGAHDLRRKILCGKRERQLRARARSQVEHALVVMAAPSTDWRVRPRSSAALCSGLPAACSPRLPGAAQRRPRTRTEARTRAHTRAQTHRLVARGPAGRAPHTCKCGSALRDLGRPKPPELTRSTASSMPSHTGMREERALSGGRDVTARGCAHPGRARPTPARAARPRSREPAASACMAAQLTN